FPEVRRALTSRTFRSGDILLRALGHVAAMHAIGYTGRRYRERSWDRRGKMRQIAIRAITAAVLCSPFPGIAQGFQYGSVRGSRDIHFDKRSFFPCYRLNS